MSQKGKLIILSGPSGSGKSTVIDRLLGDCPVALTVCPSATTRKPRADDQHVKQYTYMSVEQFEAAKANGEFLESANVSGNWYGTLREPVETAVANGDWLLLEIDVQGGLALKGVYPECVMIFIKAASLEEYEQRLRKRGTNSEAEISRRLEVARRELELGKAYPYHIVNDDLEKSVEELKGILTRIGGSVCA